MKIKTFFLLFLLMQTLHAAEVDLHNVINCEIYDNGGKLIRKFPGRICVFMNDGSLLSAEKENLIYYDKLRNVLWSKEIHPHHQINTTLDGNDFLVVGSKVKNLKKEKIRYDVLYRINKKGEIVSQFDLYDNQLQFDKSSWDMAFNRHYSKIGNSEFYLKADWEVTHTNSLYEIPENKISKKLPAFSRGNFIVNDISLMRIFVIDHEFKKILWQKQLINEEWTMFHDVQVIPDSELLLFYDNGSPLRPLSRLVEFNMSQNKIEWQYPKIMSAKFYSPKMGGVQLLKNDNFLYNDITSIPVAREVSADGEIKWSLTPRGDYASKDTKEPFQQIKRMDLSEFLKKHRGL